MNTLFNLDEIPQATQKIERTLPRQRWYLVGKFEGSDQLYFLWKLHTNGGDEWVPIEEMGRKKPHFYASWQSANRAGKQHGTELQIRQWAE